MVTLLLWSAIASSGYEDWRPMMQFTNMAACVKAQEAMGNRTTMCISSYSGEVAFRRKKEK